MTRTTLRVSLVPITLDKNALIEICNIVIKAGENDPSAYNTFEIEGKSEVVRASSIQSFANARWPRELERLYLNTESRATGREINIRISGMSDALFTFSTIEVTGQDADWVSARVRELENFISDHKNFHWVFRNWFSIIIQAIGLSALLVYIFGGSTIGTIIAIFAGYVYLPVVRKIFPLVVLETGRPSTLKTVRKFLIFVIPAVFVGLIVSLLSKLLGFG